MASAKSLDTEDIFILGGIVCIEYNISEIENLFLFGSNTVSTFAVYIKLVGNE